MKTHPRAHSSCAHCRYRMEPCIYSFFGPCKWVEDGDETTAAATEEANASAKDQEITERQVDQSQLVFQDDQMLAADVEKDLAERLSKL